MKACLRMVAFTVLLAQASLSAAQPRSTEHLLLGSEFGEFCTMCEAFLLCSREHNASYERLPADGNYTLYYFPTRSFWQQIATIWEWFKMMFVPMNTHNRPLQVTVSRDGQRDISQAETTFSIEPARIYVPQAYIDRNNGQWHDAQHNPIGQCQRLPLWQTLDELKTLEGADE